MNKSKSLISGGKTHKNSYWKSNMGKNKILSSKNYQKLIMKKETQTQWKFKSYKVMILLSV